MKGLYLRRADDRHTTRRYAQGWLGVACGYVDGEVVLQCTVCDHGGALFVPITREARREVKGLSRVHRIEPADFWAE